MDQAENGGEGIAYPQLSFLTEDNGLSQLPLETLCDLCFGLLFFFYFFTFCTMQLYLFFWHLNWTSPRSDQSSRTDLLLCLISDSQILTLGRFTSAFMSRKRLSLSWWKGTWIGSYLTLITTHSLLIMTSLWWSWRVRSAILTTSSPSAYHPPSMSLRPVTLCGSQGGEQQEKEVRALEYI